MEGAWFAVSALGGGTRGGGWKGVVDGWKSLCGSVLVGVCGCAAAGRLGVKAAGDWGGLVGWLRLVLTWFGR